ncbi:MAG: hypothetical protein ACI3XD_07770 [Oscillospiraceae bacterium]
MDTPIEKVHDLLNRPRSSADFSPSARYAVSRLCDYAEQERTIDDLRQQLSFMQQALKEADERKKKT